jgi:GH25 family lysozyme M1 (1,4-beta-N-acetylmuramidase)
MMVFKPICIDIYRRDNVIDQYAGKPQYLGGFNSVKDDQIAFLIHKCSEGTSSWDNRYAARREVWMQGGPVKVTDVDGAVLQIPPCWGAYHFFHGQDPAAEAKWFLQWAKLTATDIAVIDWENVGSSGYEPTATAADIFCSVVEQATGRPCWVYGGNVPRERLLSSVGSAMLDRFSKRPLWLCAYVSETQVHIDTPLPWKEAGPTLFQDDGDKYGPGPHMIPGISNYCDNSTVTGSMTVAKLYTVWTGQSLTQVPVA